MDNAKFAVTHASGLLAESLLERMAESGISSDSVVLLDQPEQVGNRLVYGDTHLTVLDQHEYDYENLTAVLLLEPDSELAGLLQHADCYVISHYPDTENKQIFNPYQPDLPEPPCAIKLASAELSSLLPAVNVIHTHYAIQSLSVVNVLSSSLAGKAGIDELASQTISLLNSQQVKSDVFQLQLAFNMIPQESSIEFEKQLADVLNSQSIHCSVQNILVPAFHGLCIAVNVETAENLNIRDVSELLSEQPAVRMEPQLISPFTDCKTGSDVLITGLHQPQNDANRLQFWVVADSVRNGLIQNYLNILEILLKSFL